MKNKNTPLRIGLVGCGNIASKAYLPFLQKHKDQVEIISCFDVRNAEAEKLAKEFAIGKVHKDMDGLLADDCVDLVLNLTHPAAHAAVNLHALQAGKHAYCEKPFALTREEGKRVLEEAAKTQLKVGCAPDTVLGRGTQNTRKLIESGAIGEPLFTKLSFISPGPEHWHSNPAFYYQEGGGPLLDMGPYYLSALIQCIGPVRTVQGRAVQGFSERVIGSMPLKGETIPVNTPTYYTGTLETHSGVIVNMEFSFDHKYHKNGPCAVEFHGSRGTILGTNPNGFAGEILLNQAYPPEDYTPQPYPQSDDEGRGLGILDMKQAIEENREPRAGGALAYHVLDIMLAFHDSEKSGQRVQLESTCMQPPAMAG